MQNKLLNKVFGPDEFSAFLLLELTRGASPLPPPAPPPPPPTPSPPCVTHSLPLPTHLDTRGNEEEGTGELRPPPD